MDGQQQGIRRRRWGMAMAATLIGTGVTAFAMAGTAQADLERADQRCFTVAGGWKDAALVNLTPVGATGAGDGQLISSQVKNDPPVASNVNFGVDTVDPNVAVTPIGSDREVCFQNSVHASVDLVADHLGTIVDHAYRMATPTGAPNRVVDTREQLGGDRIAPAGQLCFAVEGDPGDAALVNITPVGASGAGDGQLISSDAKHDPPVASNVNFGPGTVDPNVAVALIGADGEVCFQNSVHASVDLVADHLGSIAASAFRSATESGAPNRVVDTRRRLGGERIPPSGQLCVAVEGAAGDAALVNLTPIGASGAGDGQLISSDVKSDPPVASNVNFRAGSVDPNVAIAPIGADGEVCFQNSQHSSVDVVIDHLGSVASWAYEPASASGAPERRVDTRYDTDDDRPECAGSDALTFDWQTARTMYGISSRAYEIDPGERIGATLDTYGGGAVQMRDEMECWKLVGAFRGTDGGASFEVDTEVIVARNVATYDVVVAFRGTEFSLTDFRDIETDLAAELTSFRLPDGQLVNKAVHEGFEAGYQASRTKLLNVLALVDFSDVPDARVYFTGHSLGGALATLGSLDLVDELMARGYDRDEVVTYTFGAPRSMTRTMSGHHATFVPQSYAVANATDIVPHVPPRGGDTDYTHLRNMVVLHAVDDDPRLRIEQGDGRNYGGCSNMLIASFADHGRAEYDRRLNITDFVGKPTASISLSGGEFRLRWTSPIEGPCDWIGLFEKAGTLTNASNPIRDRWVDDDGDNSYTTSVGKSWDHWVAYVNMFGEIVSKQEYFPGLPSVSLRRNENCCSPDTIDFYWSVGDPGDHDLIVLFDRDPNVVGPNGYYKQFGVNRVEAKADTNSPERTAIWVGSDPNDWWVAYIMVDDDGRQRILATSRGVRG
ncbi:MAG: lipase family protein [Ilumatobacter fluminis]|uniref:lipase family protein n=1 Tax=Ilumatobacter fluminis TaxID=467091 RepID=UPI0032ED54C4